LKINVFVWVVGMVQDICFDTHALFIVTAADPNAWRLGRIEEGDHETPV
jgi:hypothetical protein